MAYVQRVGIAGMVHANHVQLQVAALSELVSAQVAVVRLLAGVSAVVLLQKVLEAEALRTDITLESILLFAHDEDAAVLRRN